MANDIGNLNVKISMATGAVTSGMNRISKEAQSLSNSLSIQVDQFTSISGSVESYQSSLSGLSQELTSNAEARRRQAAEIKEAAANEERLAVQNQRNLTSAASLTRQVESVEERRIRVMSELNGAMQRGDITQQTYNRHLLELESSHRRVSAAANMSTSGSRRGTFAVQQLAFGAQDAATQFGTQGLAGAVRAGSNNVIQFASLLGPMAGTVAAVVGVGVALWADYADKQKRAMKTIEDHKKKLAEFEVLFRQLDDEVANAKWEIDFNIKATDLTEMSLDEIESQQDQLQTKLEKDTLDYQNTLAKLKETAKPFLGGATEFLGAGRTREESIFQQTRGSIREDTKLAGPTEEQLKAIRDLERAAFDQQQALMKTRFEYKLVGDAAVDAHKRSADAEQEQKDKSAQEFGQQMAAQEEERKRKAEEVTRSISRQTLGELDSESAKTRAILDEREKRLAQINELRNQPGANAEELDSLERMINASAEVQLRGDKAKESSLGTQSFSAAGFGSSEAFSRVALAVQGLGDKNKSADEWAKGTSENTREIVKLLKESAEKDKESVLVAGTL